MELNKYTEIACEKLGLDVSKLNDEGFLNSVYSSEPIERKFKFAITKAKSNFNNMPTDVYAHLLDNVRYFNEILHSRNFVLSPFPCYVVNQEKTFIEMNVFDYTPILWKDRIEEVVNKLKKI
jgi:pyoverdine/dityrosine biosynthesis protein Dit1